jgi:CRP-like cAMP-binding protein
MALEDDIDFLDRIPTFHVIGREAQRILAISAETVHLRGGDVLFEEGEPADGAFVLREGTIVFRGTHDEPESAPLVARAGTLIGEAALIVEGRRPATATALDPSSLWRVSRAVFLRTLEGEPDAARALRRMIAARVEVALGELDNVLPRFEDGFIPARGRRD